MTFNSVTFAGFLMVVLAVHWGVRPAWRNHVVLAASAVFYGWWDVRFLSLLAASTIVDFTVAKAIARSDDRRRRRALLVTSVAVNLGVLGVFKYADFFMASLSDAMGQLGLTANPVLLGVVLPVGISFYTFQTMSYTIDVHRGRLQPEQDLVTFATFVAWFPQLVAGPIERAGRLLPQIRATDRAFPRGDVLAESLSLILLGLVKKVVLADGVAVIVNDTVADLDGASWIALVVAAVGFSIQIYGDFSGYSSIARGVSLLLGVRLMTNFTEPYLSRSITEFWQRWHISLSTWLRDYLYIPLGGNRGGGAATMRNLGLTMLLGGLWHGAAWTFVLWGGLHGLYLAVHRRVGASPDGSARPRRPWAVPATFALVTLTWVPFRAGTLAATTSWWSGIATGRSGAWSLPDLATVAVLCAVMVGLDHAQRAQLTSAGPLVRQRAAAGAVVGLSLVGLLLFSGGTPQPFIYFQF